MPKPTYSRTEYNRKYREEHRESLLAQAKAYRDTHREAIREYKQQHHRNNKKAIAKRDRERYLASPETKLKPSRSYHDTHREAIRAQQRQYYRENVERIKAYQREHHSEYCKAHPDVITTNRRRYRARRFGAEGSHTEAEWLMLKEQYSCRCLSCGKPEVERPLTRDHVIPLSKGGNDAIDNIQPLCLPCNSRKGTKATDYRQASTMAPTGIVTGARPCSVKH